MNPSYVKLTNEIAEDIRARIKSLDFGAIEKISKARESNGTFDVIISTEDLDRAGEIVRQNGWEMANYKNNPIVLWGHDYYSLPIGVCTETYKTEYHGMPATGAKGVFYPAEINPFAQQVRAMYDFGVKSGLKVGCTTSVGFIPKEFDEENGRIITRAELLEFSFVPVPANQGVGPAEGRSITFEEARALGLDVAGMRSKGVTFAETLGVIPRDIRDSKAVETDAWLPPTLKDFTDSEWNDLTGAEKREIAGHFAWAKAEAAAEFEDLKLPHHRASDGAVVFNGLKAAMAALLADESGIEAQDDKKAAYDHLAAHYKAFGKEPPEFKAKAAEAGDACTMEDGSSGVLATDPDDAEGALICVPAEAKAADPGHASQRALLKSVTDEHERHEAEMEKSLEAYQEAAAGELSDEARETMKDLRSAMQDEQTLHRAKSVASFRGFDPAADKAFDRNPHLKAMRDEHDAYEAKTAKALDEFEAKAAKAFSEEDAERLSAKLDESRRAHRKASAKIAKAMCKAAFGEEDVADEKTLGILREYLAPHVDPQLLPAVAAKIGSKLSAATKAKLGEAHQHLKAASAVLEELHGALADGSEEDSRSDGAKSGAGDGSREPRSKPRQTSRSEDPALKAHLLAREIVGGIEAAARRGLGDINAELRSRGKK